MFKTIQVKKQKGGPVIKKEDFAIIEIENSETDTDEVEIPEDTNEIIEPTHKETDVDEIEMNYEEAIVQQKRTERPSSLCDVTLDNIIQLRLRRQSTFDKGRIVVDNVSTAYMETVEEQETVDGILQKRKKPGDHERSGPLETD